MWQVPPEDNNNSYSSGGNSPPWGAQSCLQELAGTWGSYVLQLFTMEDNGGAWADELCQLHLSHRLSESAWKAAHACTHRSPPQDQEQKNLHLQGPNAACSRGTAAWQLGSLLGDGREQGRWAGLLHRMRTQASGVNLAPCERHCAQTFAAKHVNWDLLAPGSLPFPARYPGGACMGYLSQRSGTGKVCSSESLFTGMPMLRLNVNILKEKRDPPVCSLSLAAKPCFA